MTVSIDLDRSPGWVSLLNGTGRLGHSTESFDLNFVHDNPELSDLYEIGSIVLGLDELGSSPAILLTSDEYGNEEVQIYLAERIRLTLADPF